MDPVEYESEYEESGDESYIGHGDNEIDSLLPKPITEENDGDEPDVDIIAPDEVIDASVQYSRESIIVDPKDWRTTDIMSKYEQAAYISARAASIAKNNDCTVPIDGLSDPILMAKRELMMRKAPIGIRRKVGEILSDGVIYCYYELRSPNTLQFSETYPEVL